MKFLDRTVEIEKLNRHLRGPEPAFIVVYGRRRCGKSTLLKRVLKQKDVYFQADLVDGHLQLQNLAREIGLSYAGFDSMIYPDWESLFTNLNRFFEPNGCLMLDEFPYLVRNNSELPSILQRLIDSKRLKYNIIVCGSSQQMMQNIVLKRSEPLYGRASLILRIKELMACWITESISTEPIEAIAEYAIWGGVPRYWEIRNKYPNLKITLLKEVFDKDSIFYEEPIRLLADDMRTSVQAYSILNLIGQGCHRLSEIAARLGKQSTDLAKPLANLLEIGYIRKEIPFGEHEKNSKKSVYKISDSFFRFYYRFILPNKSAIELGLNERILNQYLTNKDMYESAVWEDLVRLSVPYSAIAGETWDIARRWWGRGADGKKMEIDIVAESIDKKKLLIGEVKWSDKPDASRIKEELVKKSGNIPAFSKYQEVIFAQWHKKHLSTPPNELFFYPQDVLNLLKR